MKMEQIEKLVKLIQKSDLNELYWSEGESKLVLKKSGGTIQAVPPISSAPQLAAVPTPTPTRNLNAEASNADSAPTEVKSSDNGKEITSPMVGTFYLSPSPDAKPFVQVGDSISKGQVLCIVEAMKLMNEIESDVSGVIKDICVDNETPVEFGTVLFKIA